MEVFKGPLGSHRQYIAHIALPNANDYSLLLQRQRESGECKTPAKYTELRYLMNCVESFNNVPDYVYHDLRPDDSPVTLDAFRDALQQPRWFLEKVAAWANAYKHSVRGRKGKGGKGFARNENALHASDLQEARLRFRVGVTPTGRPLSEVQYTFDGIHGEDLVGAAFRFWVDYLNGKFSIDVSRVAQGLDPVCPAAR